MTYQDFLARKLQRNTDHGREVSTADVHPMLHGWQQEIVAWACQKGRARALFDRVVGDTPVTPETAEPLEAALREAAE